MFFIQLHKNKFRFFVTVKSTDAVVHTTTANAKHETKMVQLSYMVLQV